MKRAFLVAALGWIGRVLDAQSASLAGRIVAHESGEPLAYAIVGIEGLDRGQFANDSGAFFFGELPVAAVRLRVRRLGYQPFDTTIVLPRGETTTLRVELSRVALRLHEVDVRAHPPCRKPGAPPKRDSTLFSVFAQLRMNAEQYELLTRKYPLVYVLEVLQSSRLKAGGSIRVDSTSTIRIDALPKWRYKPGRLAVRQGMGYFVHLPTLVDFADKSFIANHCFHYGGLVQLAQESMIRLDVVASRSLKSYDVSGSIYLDPMSFQIRRTLLQLTMPFGAFGHMQDFEMTTDFQEILPAISVISRLHAVQRFNPRATSLDYDEAYELQQLRGYQFLKSRPGDTQKRGF